MVAETSCHRLILLLWVLYDYIMWKSKMKKSLKITARKTIPNMKENSFGISKSLRLSFTLTFNIMF